LPETITAILDLYMQYLPVSIASTTNFGLHEGVSEILNLLQQNEQIALGLLTGNIEKGARMKLERVNLNSFFPVGAYGCDSASRLDLPAIAHQRAQKFYNTVFSPPQIVIIGDAENDVLCAKHYGAVSLAVSTGNTSAEELRRLGADYIFPSLKNTSEIIKAILSEEPHYSPVRSTL
jgi:phosphoglycolate phosphatase